ncbi:MAG: hypothetical protein EZS28_023105 [Streblomastix strix]|uniref:Uncharacterized protein n=1 Tax=Streblomastix strix TaxID=222440 RepID=A0A5J4VFN5_9EUKA|nr:MAG: hypothetical protein EZS28_023105 [Streblomastix strix]
MFDLEYRNRRQMKCNNVEWRIELKISINDWCFLEAIYTSSGNAIDVNAFENSSIEAKKKNQQQRVNQKSLIGCRAVTGITDEQDISFCFEIMNETDQYINERDLLHSSCSVIRYIEKERPNSDGSNGRVETLVFWNYNYLNVQQ